MKIFTLRSLFVAALVTLFAAFNTGLAAQNVYTLGTGTFQNTLQNYPTSYGQYWSGHRVQYLIPASELNALGASASNLLSIAFDVVTPAPATITGSGTLGLNLSNFTIKMGTTTSTSLLTWVSAPTQVYTVSSFPTTIGWNTHTFTHPFAWDGVSNLVIETCFDNNNSSTPGSSSSYNAVVNQTPVVGGYSPIIHTYGDQGNVCGLTTPYMINNPTWRPNIRFTFAPNVPVDAGVSAITQPSSPSPAGLAPVKVNIKNRGVDTLTSVTIGWSVNGVVQTPTAWMGTLLSMATDSNITLGTFNFPIGTSIVKAWTSLPNGVADTVNSNDTVTAAIVFCNLLNGTYTIGPSGADYSSINAALSALDSCGISGPVTFNILPGTYTEQITLVPVAGISDTSRITIQSLSGNPADVIVKHNATSTSNYVLRFNGADYYTVQNITIKAENPTYAYVVSYTGNADYNILNGNIIISQPGSSNTTAGIFNENSVDNYNIISNNKIMYGYYGIIARGVSSIVRETGTTILNNQILDWHYFGMHLRFIDSLTVRGNIIRSVSNSANNQGTYMSQCGKKINFIGNRIECRGSGEMYGLYLYFVEASAGSLIANNFIAQPANNNALTYGIFADYSTNIKYLYNSVQVVSSSHYAVYVNNNTSPFANNQFINNQFINLGGGYAFYASPGGVSGIGVMDYNNYYSPGSSTLAFWNATVCATLAQLQAVSGKSYNSHSLNPKFISSWQLYPANSALDNLGTSVPEITDDIDGKPRSSSTPDIGAAEFSILQNDAGVISGPASPISIGQGPVYASFRNYGTLSLTSVNLSFSVDGGTPVTYAWTGNLAPDSSAGPVTIGSFNFTPGNHIIKIWTSSPNGVTDSNSVNDAIYVDVFVCQLISGTYTIGGLSADYQSFAAAIAAMTSCGINGNITFNVLPGIYTEQVTISEIPGASQANRVTFKSSSGNAADVVLQFAPISSTSAFVVNLDGADYITFQNMTIAVADTGSAFGNTILIRNNAKYNVFSGNIIRTLVTDNTNYSAIYSPSSGKEEFNMFSTNIIKGGYYGIYWYGPGQGSGQLEKYNVFESNTISDFYFCGAYFFYQDAVIVNKNKLSNSTASVNAYGIHVNYCHNNIQVTKNRVGLTNNGSAYPIYLYYCSGNQNDYGLIANNFSSFTGVTNATVYGLYIHFSSFQSIYHNSVNLAGGPSTSRALSAVSSANNQGLRIKNNIFSNKAGGYAIYQSGVGLSIEMLDYNNYFTTGNYMGYWQANHTNLASWQSATGFDTNSVSINPNFLSNNSLYPLSASLNNLGTPIPDVFDDIDDNQRSLLTPDMGAAEYSPPSDDAGLVAILSPLSPLSPGTYPVSVSFKNSGLNVMTSVKLNWKLDTLPVQTQQWNGYLLQDSTFSPYQLGNLTLPYGFHTVKVWVSAPNNAPDANTLNDTLTQIIHICDVLNSTYTIGTTLSDFPSFTAAINAMLGCGIVSTVTFNVKPGTYNEQVNITEIPGASAANRIIFQSLSGNPADVILTWNQQNVNSHWTLRLDGADYVTFRNLTINVGQGTQTYGRAVVLRGGAGYTVFENNIITTRDTTSSNFAAVYCFDGRNEYNQFTNNQISGGYYGIYNYGSGFDKGNVISNNKVSNYYYSGIYNHSQDGILISGNHITCAPNTANNYAIYVYYNTGGGTITNNLVKLSGTGLLYGIYLYYCDGTSANPFLLSNNSVYATNVTSTIFGLNMYESSYINIYHNSFYIPGGSYSSRCVYISGQSGLYNRLYNNLIVNKGPGMGVQTYYTGNIGLMDYNDYYIPNGIFGYWVSVNVSSFVSWKAITSQDTNSINIDPNAMILNDTIVPTSSSVNNLGTPLASVTTDIAGKPRNPSTPDMGAYEFSPIAYEAELVSATGPANPCDLGAEHITVSIRNNGSMMIDSLYASYQVQGGMPVTEVVQNNIASGATLNYTFTTAVNLATPADTIFHFRVAIYLPADIIHINDSLGLSITSNLTAPPPLVNNVAIPHNTSTTLHVVNPQAGRKYLWYASDTSLVEIAKGDTFVTPLLNTTTVYWVASVFGSSFSTYKTGPGTLTTLHSPCYGNYDYSWSASIYKASEIKSSGSIDSLGFFVKNLVSGYTMINQKVYLAHTADTQWTTLNKPDPSTMTLVYNGMVSWNSDWNVFPFISTFNYNGTSSLLVYWENWDGSWNNGNPSFSSSTASTANLTKYSIANLSFPAGNGSFESRPDIYLTGRDNGCPSIRIPDTVFVQQPALNVNAGLNLAICAGDTAQLGVSIIGGVAPFSYGWSPAASLTNTGVANPKAFPSVTTTYSVTVTDQNGDTGTDDVIVTVNPLPQVSLFALANVCVYWPSINLGGGLPTGGTFSGPGVSNNLFYPSVAGTGNHTITYSYTSTSTGCTGKATQNIFVDPCPGTDEPDGPSLELFPNPTNDVLNLKITGVTESVQIRMLNMEGQVIFREQLAPGSSSVSLSVDVSRLPAGVYYIRVEGEKINRVDKVVIE